MENEKMKTLHRIEMRLTNRAARLDTKDLKSVAKTDEEVAVADYMVSSRKLREDILLVI